MDLDTENRHAIEELKSEKKKKKEKKKLDSSKDEAEKSEKKRKADDDGEDEETKELSDGSNLKKAKVVEDENPNSLSKFRISEAVKAKLKSKRIEALFPIQVMTFNLVHDGSDLVGRARTGQRFINRSKPPIGKEQQENLTRWAVLFGASLLKNNATTHEALMAAISKQ